MRRRIGIKLTELLFLYDEPSDIKSDVFRRFELFNGFADIRIGNEGQGIRIQKIAKEGDAHRVKVIIYRLKMLSENINCIWLN
jgi:methionine salvage enolase-phosphatase E1